MNLRRRGRPSKHPRRIDKYLSDEETSFCVECGNRLIYTSLPNTPYALHEDEHYKLGHYSPNYELVCPRCGLIHITVPLSAGLPEGRLGSLNFVSLVIVMSGGLRRVKGALQLEQATRRVKEKNE